MRRSARKHDGMSVSLFPFLAVLLCTMGALLVILIVIAQQARANAARRIATTEAASEDNQQIADDLAWQIEQYAEARQKTAEQLKRNRLKLSHLEDHLRRLRDQTHELRAAAAALDADNQATDQQRDMAHAELEIIEAEVARGVEELAQTRQRNLKRPKSYAIIPYEGPNQTRRRPIYIECLADRVLLQPEGVELKREDFEGPLGPGNPLAAALRATSEHLRRVDPIAGDPYPLLLVRPDGIAAFSRVRAAIKSWGPDFGYEMVESEWKLDFPPADPYLAGVQQQAVEAGRRLQQRLVRAAPSQYSKRPRYRASTNGRGFVRERVGGGGGSGSGRSQTGFGGGSANSPRFANRQPSGGSAQSGTARYEQRNGAGQSGDQSSGDRSSGNRSARNQRGNATAASSGGKGGGGAQNGSQQGSSAGSAASGAAGSSAGGAAGGSAGSASSGSQKPLAEHRGRDWALQGASPRSTPITRPIRIAVRDNWLAIINKQGVLLTKPVAMPRGVEAAIDEFVSSIWTHTDSWGIAGSGLYWRPVLLLDVDASGARRAQELQVLLHDSGMDIESNGGDSP